jgi:zinc protease
MMLDPVIPEEELGPVFNLNEPPPAEKRERCVVIEEIRMREDQPWTKVYNAANQNMYTNHPYKRDVIGHANTIASIPKDVIMNYYKTHYTPANMTTIIAGDFDTDAVLKKVVKEFDFKGRKNCQNPLLELDKPVNTTKYIENTALINTGFAITGFIGPQACDIKNNIGLEMANVILGEGQSSRLYQNLIEKAKEPVFNIVTSDYYNFRDGSNFFVQANFKPECKDKAIDSIKNELENLINGNISENEFKKAKKKLKSAFAQDAETVSDIADNIGYYMTVCGSLELVEEYLRELENFSVSDLKAIVKKYLPIEHAVISVLIPQ